MWPKWCGYYYYYSSEQYFLFWFIRIWHLWIEHRSLENLWICKNNWWLKDGWSLEWTSSKFQTCSKIEYVF
jgi:hypothetical protein